MEHSSPGDVIKDFTISLTEDFEWFIYPSACWTSTDNIPDMWTQEYMSNCKVLQIGGTANENSHGLFYSFARSNWKFNTISARLQYIPSN